MYKMKADGVVFYDPSSDDMALHVLSPKAKYELNKSGSLEFTMLPGNVMYDGLHKLKTIITLEQDGEEIFRGRVLETETDLYNQKKVYCEGELAYLLDTMMRPYDFDGKAADYLALLIENHNKDVEDYKKFTVGLVTAVTDEDTVKVESEDYTNTLEEIRALLLDEFNGYLRVRWENSVRYLDYVDKFDQPCSQEINFGVNLVDIENNVNAQDVCSVLIPIGKSEKGTITTIEKANGGKDYIESAELIAKYGRIVKSYTFEKVEDPEELLELGQKHMERMEAETTLTITAVDLKTAGADVDGIRLGDTVKLVSAPHGLNKEDVCTKIQLNIEKPEKSEYTFGYLVEPLTDKNASANRKNRRNMDHMHRWLKETENSFEVEVKALNSRILLKADKIDLQGYVTMDQFEAVEGWSTNFAGESISGSSIVGGYGDFDELVCGQLLVGGSTLRQNTTSVVTSVTAELDGDGNVIGVKSVSTPITYYTA
jgi:phage minor structural protein